MDNYNYICCLSCTETHKHLTGVISSLIRRSLRSLSHHSPTANLHMQIYSNVYFCTADLYLHDYDIERIYGGSYNLLNDYKLVIKIIHIYIWSCIIKRRRMPVVQNTKVLDWWARMAIYMCIIKSDLSGITKLMSNVPRYGLCICTEAVTDAQICVETKHKYIIGRLNCPFQSPYMFKQLFEYNKDLVFFENFYGFDNISCDESILTYKALCYANLVDSTRWVYPKSGSQFNLKNHINCLLGGKTNAEDSQQQYMSSLGLRYQNSTQRDNDVGIKGALKRLIVNMPSILLGKSLDIDVKLMLTYNYADFKIALMKYVYNEDKCSKNLYMLKELLLDSIKGCTDCVEYHKRNVECILLMLESELNRCTTKKTYSEAIQFLCNMSRIHVVITDSLRYINGCNKLYKPWCNDVNEYLWTSAHLFITQNRSIMLPSSIKYSA